MSGRSSARKGANGEREVTPARVERAMRHSIETAWDRGDLEALHKRFGYTVSIRKGRPTVGEFIALAAEYVSGRA